MKRDLFFYLRLTSFVTYLLSCGVVAVTTAIAMMPSLHRRLQGAPIKLDGNAILGMVLQGCALAVTSFFVPERITAGAWQLAGALLAAPAAAGFLIACAIVQPKAGVEQLVEIGPYNLVRHPMYLAFGLLLLATLLLAADPRPAAVAGPLYMTGSALRIAVEERDLRNRYTDEWNRYAARVRHRLIPFVF